MAAMTPYQQEVLFVDQRLSEFFAFLRENKRDENTLTLITSDHGEAFGEHGEMSHSLFVYNTTLRIPLMVSMPDYNLAEFLLHRGARDEAFRYYDESIKRDFRTAIFRKARLKNVIGATDEAHRILQAAEKSDPRDFRVNYERGLIYYRHNEAQPALAELQKALKKSPGQKWLHYEIGLVYLRLNQLEKAQTAMREFLAAAPPEMKEERVYAQEVLKQKPS